MYLTNFGGQTGLKNIVNNYLKEKEIDVFDKLFNSEKSIINLENIDDIINMIIENCKPKTKTEHDDEKRAISVLSKIRWSTFDSYAYHNTVNLCTVPSKY